YLLHGEAMRPLGAEGVLLVGDAAGLAYPRSGEGIRPAVESGLLAAETLIETKLDPGSATLARYTERIEARFGPREKRPDRSPQAWLQPAWKQALASFLFARQRFARNVVLDRWFLHRAA